MMIHEELANIFRGTQNWLKSSQDLKKVIEFSMMHEKLYHAEKSSALPEKTPHDSKICVSGDKSLQEAA